MSNKPLKPRRLMVESLETRAMLAGNVTVAVTDGVLHVTGDAAANDVQIRQLKQTFEGEWPGAKLEISGNYRNRNDTLINGQSEPLIVEGVKSGTVISLGNGNNALRIANIPQDETVPVRRQVNLSGTVTITTGSGDDDIRLYVNNGKSVSVSSGRGEDYIQLTQPKLQDLTVTTDPASSPGEINDWAKDFVKITSLKARGDVTINGGERRDFIRLLWHTQIDGAFAVDLRGGTAPAAQQSNELYVSGSPISVFNGPVNIVGGPGTDGVLFEKAVINGAFNVALGDALDVFLFRGTSNVELRVFGERGNDRFTLGGTIAAVYLDGGSGTDRLTRDSDFDLGEETLVDIEEDRTSFS